MPKTKPDKVEVSAATITNRGELVQPKRRKDGRVDRRSLVKSGGRPRKTDEEKLIRKLTPMEPIAHEQLKSALKEGHAWALRLFFDYMYGKPKQTTQFEGVKDVTITFED